MSAAEGFRPGSISSLWDMLRIYADKFVFIMNVLALLPCELDKWPPDQLFALSDNDGRLGPGLRGLVGLFTELEMPVSKRDAEALMNMYERKEQWPAGIVSKTVSTLCASVAAEFEGRLVIAIGLSGATLFKPNEPLFGPDVDLTFSKSSEDIAEAGKCLGLGRSTACVFHLMQVMERAVKTLGDRLNVTVVDKNNKILEWGPIVNNIDDRLKASPLMINEKWSGVVGLLHRVRIAWRNPTMHPKQTYTEEEAKDIFSACRSFMKSFVFLILQP